MDKETPLGPVFLGFVQLEEVAPSSLPPQLPIMAAPLCTGLSQPGLAGVSAWGSKGQQECLAASGVLWAEAEEGSVAGSLHLSGAAESWLCARIPRK